MEKLGNPSGSGPLPLQKAKSRSGRPERSGLLGYRSKERPGTPAGSGLPSFGIVEGRIVAEMRLP